MDVVRIQSKFLIVSSTHILHPGQLVVCRGRVVEVTSNLSQTADIDLGETVLIPGLVNAHTHLEFSGLASPFASGANFPEWITQVVNYRRQLSEAVTSSPPTCSAEQRLQASISDGLRECFHSGTALLGDIVTPPWRPELLPGASEFRRLRNTSHARWDGQRGLLSPGDWLTHFAPVSYPRVVAFAELLGLQTERMELSWQWANGLFDHAEAESLADLGLSPHAPYSLHFPSLVQYLQPGPRRVPIAMHLAESRAELEWLDGGGGPFGTMFQSLGIDVETPPPSIEQCISWLAVQRRSLLIHGNYLTPTQIEQVAAAKTMNVVFCPRTHVHFGHAAYPLQAMLDAGAPVVLATDSRASNPNLSLWDEVVEVRRIAPHIPASDLFQWVTVRPALALGVERDYGSLEVGKLAFASSLPAPSHWTVDNLLEELTQFTSAELKFYPLSILLNE